MGALKLTYHESQTAISENWKIFVRGIEKNASSQNFCKDYFTGGSIMPGRSYSSNSYRFGYNAGSEKDDEITGVTGSHITTFYREYDTRLGRTWSLDPVFQPWQSSYSSMDNNPIWFNDPLGDVSTVPPGGTGGGRSNASSGLYAARNNLLRRVEAQRTRQKRLKSTVIKLTNEYQLRSRNSSGSPFTTARPKSTIPNREPVFSGDPYGLQSGYPNIAYIISKLIPEVKSYTEVITRNYNYKTNSYRTNTSYEFDFKTEEAKNQYLAAQYQWEADYKEAVESVDASHIVNEDNLLLQEASRAFYKHQKAMEVVGDSPQSQLSKVVNSDNSETELESIEERSNPVIYNSTPTY